MPLTPLAQYHNDTLQGLRADEDRSDFQQASADQYDLCADIAIDLLHSVGLRYGMTDKLGAEINDDVQTLLQLAMFRCPELFEGIANALEEDRGAGATGLAEHRAACNANRPELIAAKDMVPGNPYRGTADGPEQLDGVVFSPMVMVTFHATGGPLDPDDPETLMQVQYDAWAHPLPETTAFSPGDVVEVLNPND